MISRFRRAFLGPSLRGALLGALEDTLPLALGIPLLPDGVDPASAYMDEDYVPDAPERERALEEALEDDARARTAWRRPKQPTTDPERELQQPQKEKTTMGALEIQHTTEITMPWTAWFLYGPMGSGKTRAASTFPNPLFLLPANENSQLTLAQLQDKKIPYITLGKRPDGTPVKVRAHLSEVLTELDRRHSLMRASYAKAAKATSDEERKKFEAEAIEHFPWETVVADALTHLGDLLVEDVSNGGVKKMDQQAWGVIANEYRTLHSRLRNMDVHVVYTALAKTQEAEGGGIAQGGPNLIGSMAEKLPSACDVVAYMEELAGEKGAACYRAFLRKYRWWQARTRFGGFPDFMDSFDFRKLEPKIVGMGAAAVENAQAAPPA